MAKFAYKGRNKSGKIVEGQLEAADRNAAGEDLIKKGMIPVSIEPYVERVDLLKAFNARFNTKKPTPETLIIFSRQMTALMRAGVPLLTALRGLSGSVRGRLLSDRLHQIADDLQSGQSLTSGFQKNTDLFDPILISLIHVGENTGKLDEAFTQMGHYLTMERDTKKRVKQATRYPKMVMSGLGIAMVVLNIFVIPNFAKVFAKFNTELPLMTRILLGTSHFMVNYWWVLGIIIGGIYYGSKRYLETEQGSLQWDQYKLRMPIMGKIYERVCLARFCRIFSSLYGSGVPILQSLNAVAGTVGNKFIAKAILGMHSSIDRGEGLTVAASSSKIFTPLVIQMIAVGEETGRIDQMLDQVGQFYEEEVDFDLKQLADSIEPILLVVMGAMVLVLALGIFLPMWELGSAAKH
jgi:MSHA biogenesis protein MshG